MWAVRIETTFQSFVYILICIAFVEILIHTLRLFFVFYRETGEESFL